MKNFDYMKKSTMIILSLLIALICCCSCKENLELENLCKDTREIKPGQIYLGIKGEKFNGSTLYTEALEKGAKACILQDVILEGKILYKI